MDTKIFLQGFDSKKSSNTSEGLDVQFKGRRKLLPLNGIDEVISQHDLYMDERTNCNKIRLTCQVNPICSNVLFNRITEIVKDEGSSAVTFLNYGVNPRGDNETFRNVLYKPRTMNFWSGGNMSYQSYDEGINGKFRERISELITGNDGISHYANRNLTSNIAHPTNAIRDTQLSKGDSNFVYHCGRDFVNNHLIRSNTFKSICRCPNNNMGDYSAFNTICDLMRSVDGRKVIEKIYFPTSEASLLSRDFTKILSLHLYEYDDILTYMDAAKRRIVPKYNGWLGFYNTSKIKSYSDFQENEDMEIERPLGYLNGGDFVDMYPGRDLYSFVPKYNEFQHRIEKNWNYCITYPSSSYTPSADTDPFGDIIETNDGLNSLRAIYFDENTRSDNGASQLVIYSIAKHGLSRGDYVNIYKTYFDGEKTVNERIIDNGEVSEVVDEYIFIVFNSSVQISRTWVELSDIDRYDGSRITVDGVEYTNEEGCRFRGANGTFYIVNDRYVNFDVNAQRISYKKTHGDIECDYYIRIFSKLPNFKFASGDTSSEYEIYRRREEIGRHNMLEVYQGNEYDFENHVSRLAFAENIYSDSIGEIVFTDDIDLANIHDNRGRPLTSLYLTFIKNNRGYKEWYGWNNQMAEGWSVDKINTEFENIEYSHCFGPVTCGIKMSYESTCNDGLHNILTINNIGSNRGYNVDFINGRRVYSSSTQSSVYIDSSEVWYRIDRNFYGDLCCYDNYEAMEQHIEYVEHRFSTAQRESNGSGSESYFEAYIYDEIGQDDYDTDNHYNIQTHRIDMCNNLMEGYYYTPHYEIPIKMFGSLQSIFPDFLSIRQLTKYGDEIGIYRFSTLQQHFLTKGDKAMLYDKIRNIYYKLFVIDNEEDNYNIFTCEVHDERTDELVNITYVDEGSEKVIENISSSVHIGDHMVSSFKLFKMDNLGVPSYAEVLKDGTCRLIWHDVINNGSVNWDSTIEEYPFTNGRFYVNRKIDLYVRRQDPYDLYGLYNERDIRGDEVNYGNEYNYFNDEEIEC